MNDDYLWDRSGEPDPEVERLERVLVKYRYQSKPLGLAATYQATGRRAPWIGFAAAAAAILIVCGGLWFFEVHRRASTEAPRIADSVRQPEKPADEVSPPKAPEHEHSVAIAAPASRKVPPTASGRSLAESLPDSGPDLIAERQPIINPFINVETARHIERAQVLLRSFRNTRDSDARLDPDLAYERRGSRDLLYKNILLRRDAEAKGNMPVEELLGSLEPFLLDIANLPDKPSGDDLRSIKGRMQKKEIVSALQIYSAPALSQVF
jgi:hypothetical protein